MKIRENLGCFMSSNRQVNEKIQKQIEQVLMYSLCACLVEEKGFQAQNRRK